MIPTNAMLRILSRYSFARLVRMKRQTKKPKQTVTPAKFISDLWAARISFSLIAALDLDIFTAISQGHKTADDIAKAVNASRHGIERLLDTLVGMEYLTRKGSQFRLTPVADVFLVRTRPSFIGAMADETRITLPGWVKLGDVIRSGRSAAAIDTEEGRDFFPRLVKAIFPLTYNSARALVQAFPQARLKKVERVLDVAAGTAAWSLPFAQTIPGARVTALDHPQVIPVTRQYAEQFGVADRYDYIGDDLRQVDFGQKQYDVVILGHILHSEGEKWSKILVQKSYKALKPGGTLVIAEFIPNDARTGPIIPLLFGLNMLLHSTEGDVFTMAQMKQWLKQAGFKSVKAVDAQSPSPLILATR
jgi:ubiquinone/menaquinone biosynthesis C-methylase UbiE